MKSLINDNREGEKQTKSGKERAEEGAGEITGSAKPLTKTYDPNDCFGDTDTFVCWSRPEAQTDDETQADAPLYLGGEKVVEYPWEKIQQHITGIGKGDMLVKNIRQRTIEGVLTYVYDNTATGTMAIVKPFCNSWFTGQLALHFTDIISAFSFVSHMTPVGKCRCCLSLNCSDKSITPVYTRLHYDLKRCSITIYLFGCPQNKAKDSLGEASQMLSKDFFQNISGYEQQKIIQAAQKPQPINPVVKTEESASSSPSSSLSLQQMIDKWTPLINDSRWKWVNRKQHPLMRLITSENALLTDFPVEMGNFTRDAASVQAFQSTTTWERRNQPRGFFSFGRRPTDLEMTEPRPVIVDNASQAERARAISEQASCWDESNKFDRNYAEVDTVVRLVYVPRNPKALADQMVSNTLDVVGDVISIFSKPLSKIVGVKIPTIDTSTQYLTWRYVVDREADQIFRKIDSDTHNGFNRHEWCMATLRRECLTINSQTIGYELIKTYDHVSINCDLANKALSIMVGGDYPPEEAVHIINANINVYASEYAESVHNVQEYGTVLQHTAQFVMVQYTHYYFARGPGSLVYPSF